MTGNLEVYISEVQKLDLEPGDILHLKLGLPAEALGDNQLPWIPGESELEYARKAFLSVLPEGVKVVASHFGVDPTVIRAKQDGIIVPEEVNG